MTTCTVSVTPDEDLLAGTVAESIVKSWGRPAAGSTRASRDDSDDASRTAATLSSPSSSSTMGSLSLGRKKLVMGVVLGTTGAVAATFLRGDERA